MGWVTTYHPTTEELDACVQCGLCLPVCPTFRLTGRETASPRGRLQAMKAVHQGVFPVDAAFQSIIDFCLGCRACEPVCPGLVPYGRALEGARAEIVAQLTTSAHRARALLVGPMLGSRGLLRAGTALVGLGQRLGVDRVAPCRLRRVLRGMRRLRSRPPTILGHAGGSGSSGSVALLAGCIQEEWFRPVNRAAVDLLEMAGYRVEVPSGQTCCGALAAHDGKADQARALAAQNVPVLSGYDRVVVTSAGCSAHVRGYGHWAENGGTVAGMAVDVTVAVAEAIGAGLLPTLPDTGEEVAIQDPCHLRHAQRVVDEPRLLLQAAGYRVVEVDPVGMCCGAAGLYTVLQPEASQQLAELKAEQIRCTGVLRVASANPGCEMQLRSVLGGGYDIRHPVEWYLDAVRRADPGVRVGAVEDTR